MVKSSTRLEDCGRCGLARFLDLPGGITAEQALERAQVNLAFIRNGSIKEIDAAIQRIGDAIHRGAAGDGGLPFAQLKADANLIYSLAATFGFAGLGAASAILEQHLGALEQSGSNTAEGLHLYVSALKCLRADPATGACRDIVDGLKAVSDKSRRDHPLSPA